MTMQLPQDTSWLRENEFAARPLIVVEDHVYHISELLRTVGMVAPEIQSSLTVVCLDKRGVDTDAAVSEWLNAYPSIQIAARIVEADKFPPHAHGLCELDDRIFQNQFEYCKFISSLVRKSGLLLQDIELESLEFVPRERWWETTMLASTIRGIVGIHGPKCAFVSNKRGYEATFGSELLAAGHDPRDVLNKYELDRMVVPFLQRHLFEQFPWILVRQSSSIVNQKSACAISNQEHEIANVSGAMDLVMWPEIDGAVEISGLAFDKSKKKTVTLPVDGQEFQTWFELICSRMEGNSGVDIQQIGQRIAPPGALRAEVTNSAARHIHGIRKRLKDGQNIATVHGRYKIRDELSVGIVQQRSRDNR